MGGIINEVVPGSHFREPAVGLMHEADMGLVVTGGVEGDYMEGGMTGL